MDQTTPTKSGGLFVDPHSPLQDVHDDERYLIGSLSTMKIHHGSEPSPGGSQSAQEDAFSEGEELFAPLRTKRERFTVEGSPFIHARFKRQDVLPTPAKSHFAAMDMGCGAPPSPIVIKQATATTAAIAAAATTSSVTTSAAPVATAAAVRETGKLLVICSSSDEHDTGNHQENAQRTAMLCGPQGCLRRTPLLPSVEWLESDDLPEPPITDLLRVHEFPYLDYLQKKCSGANAASLPPFYAPQGMLDSDTPLVQQSFSAAKRFCSAAMLAVDKVMSEDAAHRRVFVIGRPPGHHAGPDGCAPSSTFWRRPEMTSSGFCLLNSVAVAAAYARYYYGRDKQRAPRVAIVDIDVHHGNGTEEIVRNLQPRTTYLPLPSSWAPVSKLSYKPWLNEKDSEEVFFSSVHLFAGERFYPGSGEEKNNTDRIVNIELKPLEPGPWSPHLREKLPVAKRELLCKQASEEFREKISRLLLPKIDAFKPELLFISAGFDTHHDDFYHFLTEEDIHWVTQQLCEVVERHNGFGVISVLEGGYSLTPAPSTAQTTTKTKVKETGDSYGTRGKSKKAAAGAVPGKEEPQILLGAIGGKYCQQTDDGGLVKGVLAHTAALAGKDTWS